jgi:hypothetical protein
VTDDPADTPRTSPLISAARNGEDVVLLRALGGLGGGRFLELRPARADGADGAGGAGEPPEPPALQSLLDRGWAGVLGSIDELADPAVLDRRIARAGGSGRDELHVVMVAADLPAADPAPVLELARRWSSASARTTTGPP